MKIFRGMSKWLGQAAIAAGLLLATALAAAQTVTYFHNDPSGTPVMATDAAGNVVWKENYRPYGERLNNPAAEANNRIGYAGKPFDPSTGLSYLGARYYDPVLGRFMGVDPAPPTPDALHSINRYAYANNNPYRYVDPNGRTPVDIAFLAYDVGKLGLAIWNGTGAGAAAVNIGLDAIGVLSPVPGTGQALKGMRAASKVASIVMAAEAADGAGKSDGEKVPERKTNPSKQDSPVWNDLDKAKDGLRTSGSGSKQRYYDWDHTHGDIEVYDRNGRHLGSMEPTTGEMYKPPVPGRKIDKP